MEDSQQYPSLPQQGQNLAKFTFEVVKQVMNNNESMFVSQEVREKRMEICRACEYYDPQQNRCRHCGCFLEHKTRFAIDSCPLSKWKEADEDWIKNGFDKVVEEINKPESPVPNHPLFPLDAKLGELYTWNEYTWVWNGSMWDLYQKEENESN